MSPERHSRHRGFTLVEVLIVLTLTGLIVAGMLRALAAQKKFYARQARILDARHAMRAAATILASELRELSAQDGDLYATAADSIALRSTVGFGVVCGVDPAAGTLDLTDVSGHFFRTPGDSLMVFVENTFRDDDDTWHVGPLSQLTSGGACDTGAPGERVATVGGDLTGVRPGAPARLVRAYIYRLFETEDGRWWLGRRARSAAESDYVPVAGPMAPPAAGGLEFTFFDDQDLELPVPHDPSLVARVEITVRAPTYRTPDDPDYQFVTTSTYLRNDG